MGKYEDQLAQLAALERWVLPGLDSVHLALNEVKISYDRVHGETGFTGKTDEAIKEMLSTQSSEAAKNADALSELPGQIEAANAALALAKQAHSNLPGAEIEPELKKNILAGSWLAFPLGTLAGHEGVRLWEEHLSGEREKAAKEALDAFEADISTPTTKTTEHALNASKPSDGNYHADEAQNRKPFTPITPSGPTTPGPRATPSNFGRGGGGGDDPRIEVFPPRRPPVEPPVITDPRPPIEIPGGTGDDPVVSNPGGTGPGGSGPGGSGPGATAPSVDGGLDGSVAGAGGLAGAAGLAGGARLAGRLGAGAGGLGAGIPGMGGVGGLGAGGLGAGGFGAGGLGANGAASTMGAGSGSGSAAGGRGTGSSPGGRGGQSMMSHGQGQGGSESDRKKKRPSGLLGLAAPTLDDDGDPTLRSASAGPGARGGRSGRSDDSAVGYDDSATD